MFLTPKNGLNITPRFPLFVGQHKEANRPFLKPISGTKLHQNGMNKS